MVGTKYFKFCKYFQKKILTKLTNFNLGHNLNFYFQSYSNIYSVDLQNKEPIYFDKKFTSDWYYKDIKNSSRWTWFIFLSNHGTIIRTRITCKKIPCYMCGSACRWFLVKKAKLF